MPPIDAYWDEVGTAWTANRAHCLWREYADRHQLTTLGRWIGRRAEQGVGSCDPVPVDAMLLKTDLFDEVAGSGLAAALLAAGLRVTAIDISPAIVAEAAGRHPAIDAIVADVRRLPFPDGTFDVVFSGSTLDHFESTAEIDAALVELRRVLRPGGRLILTMDNPANPLIFLRNGPLKQMLYRIGVVPYQVGVTLGPRPLVEAVRGAGFGIVETTAVMHCPRVIAVAVARIVAEMPLSCRSVFLRLLAACEILERLPTRWLTGHYIAVCAVARAAGVETGGGPPDVPM